MAVKSVLHTHISTPSSMGLIISTCQVKKKITSFKDFKLCLVLYLSMGGFCDTDRYTRSTYTRVYTVEASMNIAGIDKYLGPFIYNINTKNFTVVV